VCHAAALGGLDSIFDRIDGHMIEIARTCGRIAATAFACLCAALVAAASASAATPERHAVPGGDVQDVLPVECLRWPYPASCRIGGVRWHPSRQEIDNMRGGSWEGRCWMWLFTDACRHMDAVAAPGYAATPERHAVPVPGGDVQDVPTVECLRWPYPASCRIGGVRWHPSRQEIDNMRGGSWEGMCWMWLSTYACRHMDAISK